MKWPWNKIERELKREALVTSAHDARAFWTDFDARARLRRQESPEPAKLPLIYGWSLATACATLLLVTGVFMMRGHGEAGGSTINSFDIGVNYRAAVVTQGGDKQAAMLWVMDMDAGAPQKETL